MTQRKPMFLTTGQVIRYYREQRGHKQAELGYLIGMTGSDVSKWETNEQSPSLENAKKIALCLRFPMDELVPEITEVVLAGKLNVQLEDLRKSWRLESPRLPEITRVLKSVGRSRDGARKPRRKRTKGT